MIGIILGVVLGIVAGFEGGVKLHSDKTVSTRDERAIEAGVKPGPTPMRERGTFGEYRR